MLSDQEKRRLRQVGLTQDDVEELEDYEANISMFVQCLLQHQESEDPVRALKGTRLLERFEEFQKAPFETHASSMEALNHLLLDTLRYLQATDPAVVNAQDTQAIPGRSEADTVCDQPELSTRLNAPENRLILCK